MKQLTVVVRRDRRLQPVEGQALCRWNQNPRRRRVVFSKRVVLAAFMATGGAVGFFIGFFSI